METVYIYALCDPETGEVRYIGKTIRLGARMTAHYNEKRTTRKCRWLKSLNGRRPTIKILETVAEDNWEEAERRQIKLHRDLGCDLTNHTDGGEGRTAFLPEERAAISVIVKRRMNDPEFRKKIFTKARAEKISAAHTGKIHSKEHVAKLPQSNKGYVLRPEIKKLRADILRRVGRRHKKGEPMHPNAKLALAAKLIGNKHTKGRQIPESERFAKSASMQNRTKSDDHKSKISDGSKKVWEARRKSGFIREKPVKIEWPTLEQLEEKLKASTIKKLAKELGVKSGTLSAFLHRRRGIKNGAQLLTGCDNTN